MKQGHRMRLLGVSLGACGLLLAACGKSSSTTTGSGGQGGSSSTVGVASVSSLGKVLTGPGGKTLYHYTPDSGSTIKCTGNCAGEWPPFVAPGGQAPATPSGVTGAFATVDRPDGSVQVTFHGMTLYEFSGDTGPGTANGEGLDGVWYAVGPSGQLVKASGAKGYGY